MPPTQDSQSNTRNLDQRILEVVREYLSSSAFTDRKLTDTPTDALAMVNRKFVTNNGTTASRPRAPVQGQPYFDTSLGKPVWRNGSNWVDATGASV